MYQANSKKTAILCIIDILKKHTDSEHTLTQKQIQDMLESEYGLKLDRKAVKRNQKSHQRKATKIYASAYFHPP